MIKRSVATFLMLMFVGLQFGYSQVGKGALKKHFTHESVTSFDLENWGFYGIGRGKRDVHKQFCMAESEKSRGVVLISPKSYGEDVVLQYDVVPLTSMTVVVSMLSVSNHGNKDGQLIIPKDYDGAISMWTKEVDGYFFAYHNLAHNYPPFVRKVPKKGNEFLAMAKQNVMQPGRCYRVEVGKVDHKVWMKVDGKLLFNTVDDNAYGKGHIVLRTRGTLWFPASVLIKNIDIYSRD
ncbi:hypothetical protein K5X82_00925 [Halosquirtibacter xylanolyticus]|uniref:hypothetical protein n=1 Tax=Halosquirtibacter xylanolyticus TaxID=3374599 RepID=UPI003748CAF5|nr:hypothetical protein K5X82_00925 [Prolixibacteraceae bacterium]